jgi:CRP-like cAMP-binding protein
MRPEDVTELRALLADTPLGASAEEQLMRSFERKVVTQGRRFAAEGDAGGTLAVVADGVVRATRRVSDDRELTVFLLRRGDVYGLLPLLDGGPCPLSLAAETDATVYVLSRRLFETFLEANPRFSAHLLAYVAGRLRECIDQLGMLGKPGAVPRVAAALVGQLPDDAAPGVVITWPMRQTDLAQALGVAPENLSRAVSRLQEMGIIHRAGGHRIAVDDPVRLRAVAERSVAGADDHP